MKEISMNYKELFITIGLMIVISIIYILIRKFIVWTAKDNQKFRTKKGCLGLDKEGQKLMIDMPMFKLTCGYILFMILLAIYFFKIINS